MQEADEQRVRQGHKNRMRWVCAALHIKATSYTFMQVGHALRVLSIDTANQMRFCAATEAGCKAYSHSACIYFTSCVGERSFVTLGTSHTKLLASEWYARVSLPMRFIECSRCLPGKYSIHTF